jgi:hypothetical protein
VLGGDALYILGNYNQIAKTNYNRLSFTSFAFPDEWSYVHLTGPANSRFFQDYASTFDAKDIDPKQLMLGSYNWGRPDADVMLSYEAASVAMYAFGKISDNVSMKQALEGIQGANACQGITGRIDFQNGQIANKAVAMLTVDSTGHTHMASISDSDQLSSQPTSCVPAYWYSNT